MIRHDHRHLAVQFAVGNHILVPQLLPLALDLPLEDVVDHLSVHGPARAFDVPGPVEVAVQAEAASGVVARRPVSGAVLVGEALPVAERSIELAVGEPRGHHRHVLVRLD